MRNTRFSSYARIIAGNGLLNTIKRHKLLLNEVETIDLYRTVTGCEPLIGAIIYMNQNKKDEIHSVISFISEYSKSFRYSHRLIETLYSEITDKFSPTFFNSVIGFLEEKIEKMKEQVDTSSKNSWEKLWEHFDFTETEINCIQLIYAMSIVDNFRAIFDKLLNFIGSNDYDDDDDEDEEEEEHHKALPEAISIMLDIKTGYVFEMLGDDVVEDCIIDPINFTLYDGIRSLLDHHL
jgi:hypothetical protein